MTHRYRRTRISGKLLTILGLSVLVACTSSHTNSRTAQQPPTPASSPAAAVASPTANPATAQSTVTGIATDSEGDTVTIGIYFARAGIGAGPSDDAVKQCSTDLQAEADSLDRALVIPFHVTARITSTLSTPIQLNFSNGLHQVSSGGNTQPLDRNPYWAMDYSDGHVCQAPGDGTFSPGTINWATAGPHATYTGSGWLILPDAITPNDPDGSTSYATKIVIIPTVRLGNNMASFTFNPASSRTSSSLVSCFLPDPAAGSTLYLATNPTAATAFGCTPGR